jgi:hypothetical protein
MGLTSTLALLAAPFLLRPKPAPDAKEVAELKARIGMLESDCERLTRLAESWRERYERAIAPIVDRELVAYEVANRRYLQVMQAQAQQMQAQAQMAMQAQNLYGQLGQAQQSGWMHCTCVPGRADALLRGDSP